MDQSAFKDYSGTIIGDCCTGFHSIALDSEIAIKRAACSADARRKINESTAYPANRHTWLTWFQELYDIYDREGRFRRNRFGVETIRSRTNLGRDGNMAVGGGLALKKRGAAQERFRQGVAVHPQSHSELRLYLAARNCQ